MARREFGRNVEFVRHFAFGFVIPVGLLCGLSFATQANAQQPSAPSRELALGADVTPRPGVTPSADVSRPPEAKPAGVEFPESDGERAPEHAVYLQILGSAGMFGVGYSYRPMDSLAIDAGIGGFAITFLSSSLVGVCPALGVSWLSGGNHNLEVGASATAMFLNTEDDPIRPFFGPHVGYRYQPSGSGVYFRALLHGVVVLERELVVPWPAIGIGRTWE